MKIKKVATPRGNVQESIFQINCIRGSSENKREGAKQSKTPRHIDRTFEFQENEKNMYQQLLNPDKIKEVASPRVLQKI